MIVITVRLTTARRRFRKRAQTLRQWPRGGSNFAAGSEGPVPDWVPALVADAREVEPVMRLVQPDPRVDDRVGDIDHQVCKHEHHGTNQHECRHYREITLEDGVQCKPGNARDTVDQFDNQLAAQNAGHCESKKSQNRQQCIAGDVPVIDYVV